MVTKLNSGENYILDGIRNPEEINEIKKVGKKMGNFYLIAVDATQTIRFKRMLSRNKSSDPSTWKKFLEVDKRDHGESEPEWGQQVGKCMEIADYKLENNSTIEDFEKEIEKVYQEILKK